MPVLEEGFCTLIVINYCFNVILFHVSNDELIAWLQFDKYFKNLYEGKLQILSEAFVLITTQLLHLLWTAAVNNAWCILVDGHHDAVCEQARGRDHHLHHQQLRAEHLCQQNWMEGKLPSHDFTRDGQDMLFRQDIRLKQSFFLKSRIPYVRTNPYS